MKAWLFQDHRQKQKRIRTKTIDQFVALRRAERGKVPGSTVSAATINKELRHLKAALRKAHEWGYLPAAPKFHMMKEPRKLLLYVTPEHFAAIYQACDVATTAAGIDLPCSERHEQTDACHRYGFQDLRRAFATMNAGRLTGDALQAMMRHRSYSTTQRYIAIARQLDQATGALYVPDLEPKKAVV